MNSTATQKGRDPARIIPRTGSGRERSVFGFHEIFHTLTVLAFLCHWAAALLIAPHPAYNLG